MLRSHFLLIALLLAPPLYADTISMEFPVTPAHWQQGYGAAVAVGTSRSYEAVQDGSLIFGNEITAEGKPDMTTLWLLGGGRLIGIAAVGNDFFVLSDDSVRGTLTLRRTSDGKEAEFPIRATGGDIFRSDGTHLWYVYNRVPSVNAMVFDVNLNIAVAEFAVRQVGHVVPGQGAAARGSFLVCLSDSPDTTVNGTQTYWAIDISGKSQMVSSTPPPAATFASNGSDYLFVFRTSAGPIHNIWAQRYSRAGLPISDLYPIAYGDAQRPAVSPVVASDGNDYFVGWYEITNTIADVYVQRFGSASITHVARGQYLLNNGIAAGPAGVLASWTDVYTGKPFMRRIDAEDEGGPECLMRPQQHLSSIASDGVTSMVAWVEDGVRVGRIARDGTLLDGLGVVLSPPGYVAVDLKIVFAGNRYVLFWLAGESVMARTIDRDGTPIGDAFRILPADDHVHALRAVADGQRILLVWQQDSRLAYGWLDASGTLTGRVVTAYQGYPNVVAGGPHPIVVWPGSAGVYGWFLDMPQSFEIPSPNSYLPSAQVVSNGNDYLVAWTQWRGFDTEVWASRLGTNGSTTAPILIASSVGGPISGAIPLFDGKHYRIVYALGSTLGEAVLDDDSFLSGRFEHTDVDVDSTRLFSLSAASTAEGSVLAYGRFVMEPSVAESIFVRFARVPPPARRRAAK